MSGMFGQESQVDPSHAYQENTTYHYVNVNVTFSFLKKIESPSDELTFTNR